MLSRVSRWFSLSSCPASLQVTSAYIIQMTTAILASRLGWPSPPSDDRKKGFHSQQQWLRWTSWLFSWETPMCFIRCIKGWQLQGFSLQLKHWANPDIRGCRNERICLHLRCHLPSECLSDSTFYIFQGDKVSLNVLAKAVTEHSAIHDSSDSSHWGHWFALTIVKFFYFSSLLHFPFVLHNTKEILLTLISSKADKYHSLLW